MSIDQLFNSTPKNYDFLHLIDCPIIAFHNHPLMFCFTPERTKSGEFWSCNKCYSSFSGEIPSFYCTFCDFKFCQNCLAKYKLKDIKLFQQPSNSNNQQISNDTYEWQKKFPDHIHLLVLIQKRNKGKLIKWKCNKCSNLFNNNEMPFYCSLCDYYICNNCMNKYNKNYYTFNSEENPFI